MPVKESAEILKNAGSASVVAIDEAQFFDDDLPQIVDKLARQGVRVIVAGLDMDYMGKPFGVMPDVMAMAEFVTKLCAICVQCGANATHSFRKSDSDTLIILGEKESYEPRCRNCFYNVK